MIAEVIKGYEDKPFGELVNHRLIKRTAKNNNALMRSLAPVLHSPVVEEIDKICQNILPIAVNANLWKEKSSEVYDFVNIEVEEQLKKRGVKYNVDKAPDIFSFFTLFITELVRGNKKFIKILKKAIRKRRLFG